MRHLAVLFCMFQVAAVVFGAPAKRHAITQGDRAVIQDCHAIELAAEDALDRARAEAPDGRARLEKPGHSVAYSCYTTEKPVYDTLLDMDVHDRLSDEGKKILRVVSEDNAYFQLSLTADEK